MLSLPRQPWFRFAANARRCGVARGRALANSPMILDSDGRSVSVRFSSGEIVLGMRLPGEASLEKPISITFADWEKAFHANSTTLEFEPSFAMSAVEWPSTPDTLHPITRTFLSALRDTQNAVAKDSGKYALNRVLIDGAKGRVAASDARQALIVGGFSFPFSDSMLVPARPLFGGKDWLNPGAMSVGLIDDWFHLEAEPFRVWMKCDRESRFPDVDSVLPKTSNIKWRFSENDASRLLRLLPTNSKDETAASVTIELGNTSKLRWRDSGDSADRELVLSNHEFAGRPSTIVLNRHHLESSLRLGFRQFRGDRPERPMCGIDGDRRHLLVTLAGNGDKSPTVEPSTVESEPEPQSPTERLAALRLPNEPVPVQRAGFKLFDSDVEAIRMVFGEAMRCVVRIAHALKKNRSANRQPGGIVERLAHVVQGGKQP